LSIGAGFGDYIINIVICQQLEWMGIFLALTFFHEQHSVSLHHTLRPLGNDDHGTVLEICLDLLLDNVPGSSVLGRALFKDHDSCLADDNPSKTKQLLLVHGEEV